MNIKKLVVLNGLFFLFCASSVRADWFVVPQLKVQLDVSSLLTKKVLVAGAIIGGVALGGYLLYRYFYVMTLPKAQAWCTDAYNVLNGAEKTYQQELSIVNEVSSMSSQKEALQEIVGAYNSDRPFLGYVITIDAEINKIDNLKKCYEKGRPQLEKSMGTLINRLNEKTMTEKERQQVEARVQQFKDTLDNMMTLNAQLDPLVMGLRKISHACKQLDGYRQELMIQKLDILQTQLAINNIQSHNCYCGHF